MLIFPCAESVTKILLSLNAISTGVIKLPPRVPLCPKPDTNSPSEVNF